MSDVLLIQTRVMSTCSPEKKTILFHRTSCWPIALLLELVQVHAEPLTEVLEIPQWEVLWEQMRLFGSHHDPLATEWGRRPLLSPALGCLLKIPFNLHDSITKIPKDRFPLKNPMEGQYWFISYNTWTTLMKDANNRRNWGWEVGRGYVGLYFQHTFFYNSKTAEKLKPIKNNRREIRAHSTYFSIISIRIFYFLWVLTYYLFDSISLMQN